MQYLRVQEFPKYITSVSANGIEPVNDRVFVMEDPHVATFLGTLRTDYEYVIIPVSSGGVHIVNKKKIITMEFLDAKTFEDLVAKAKEAEANVNVLPQSEGTQPPEVGGSPDTGEVPPPAS